METRPEILFLTEKGWKCRWAQSTRLPIKRFFFAAGTKSNGGREVVNMKMKRGEKCLGCAISAEEDQKF